MKGLLVLLPLCLACEAARSVPTPLEDAGSVDVATGGSDTTATDADIALDGPNVDAAPDAVPTGCQLGAPCDDSDPCTVDDTCTADGCKGKAKSCDDGTPCTIDVCELDGHCSHTPNMHWDCIPDLAISEPGRAAQRTTYAGTETGHLVTPSHGTLAAQLTVQGQTTLWGADLAFSAPLSWVWGPQTVVTALTDQYGGTRVRTLGVTVSSQWAAGGSLALAGRVDGMDVIPLPETATALTPYTLQPRDLHWQFQTTTEAGMTALAAAPTAVTAALSAPGDLGVPLHAACTTTALDTTPSATPRWQLTADLLNAGLRAAWLAGALDDDVSPLIADVYPPLTFTGTIHGNAPWQLNACKPGQWTLTLLDLQFDITGHLGDATFPGRVYVTLTAPAEVVLTAGTLELRLGSPVQAQVDVTALPEEFQGTDGAVGIAQAGKDKMAPKLVEGWQKQALLALPLGMNGGAVELKAGVVVVGQ